MDAKEIVKTFREHAEWAQANEWERPITLGDVLRKAADTIEELNDFQGSQCAKLLAQLSELRAENARLRAELAEQQRETASCDYLLGEADIGARAAGGEIKELKAKLELVERERDKAVEDMKVGWLCRACIKRVKGKEWCNCPAVNFVNGPEKTTTCDNFEWRGTEGKA